MDTIVFEAGLLKYKFDDELKVESKNIFHFSELGFLTLAFLAKIRFMVKLYTKTFTITLYRIQYMVEAWNPKSYLNRKLW